jgi:hypothetical protein
MKRIIIAFLPLVIFSIVFSSCKKDEPTPLPTHETFYQCDLNLTNGCFSNWTYKYPESAPNDTFLEVHGDFLSTLNELSILPPQITMNPVKTVYKTDDFIVGPYAAKMISKNLVLNTTQQIFIPGMIGSTTLDIPNQTIHIGKPYTQKPVAFQGYYKYFPANGDSGLLMALLTKFNTTLSKRDTIAIAKLVVKNTVSAYTHFELNLNYWDNTTVPDSISLLMVSSAGINLQDLFHCTGQPGSIMFVDEISYKMTP